MPFVSSKIKLSQEQDRRRKLSDADKEEIIAKYKQGDYSQRMLAEEYGVSRKLISLTVNPEARKASAEYVKNNWRKYQRTGEEWNRIVREHRRYKQDLYVKGLLKEGSNG